MSLTPALLQNMDFEHAINALRTELPNDLIWLVDWVEALQPDTDQQAIIDAAENHGLEAGDIDALGESRIGEWGDTCAILKAVYDHDLEIKAGDEMTTLLNACLAIQKVG